MMRGREGEGDVRGILEEGRGARRRLGGISERGKGKWGKGKEDKQEGKRYMKEREKK